MREASSAPLDIPSGLAARWAIVDKRRKSASETQAANIIGGPIDGRTALMFDDMISTAGSICKAAEMVHQAGAKDIFVAATHGVLSGKAVANLEAASDIGDCCHRFDSALTREEYREDQAADGSPTVG